MFFHWSIKFTWPWNGNHANLHYFLHQQFLLRKLLVYPQIPLGTLKQEKVHAQLSYKGNYNKLDLSMELDILTNLGNCWDLILGSKLYLNHPPKWSNSRCLGKKWGNSSKDHDFQPIRVFCNLLFGIWKMTTEAWDYQTLFNQNQSEQHCHNC